MTKLEDLVDVAKLAEEIAEGRIKATNDFETGLTIYNYTDRAQFQKRWSTETVTCRGLIVNDETGEVLGRGFPKFFNWQELPEWERELLDSYRTIVTDKLDGSLGIMYTAPGGTPAISTRGSLRSTQAEHATFKLRLQYPDFRPPVDWTMLFEIIYPENRIVVDYGGQDDLVLIGAIHIGSGQILSGRDAQALSRWSGPVVREFSYGSLSEAVSAPLRPGKEGLVVLFPHTDEMLKIKQQDYVELHRIVTGLNEKAIWERTGEAYLNHEEGTRWFDKVLDGIPDELHDWVEGVAKNLVQTHKAWVREVRHFWIRAQNEVWTHWQATERDRKKAFALWVQANAKSERDNPGLQKALFQHYDGIDPSAYLWRLLEPKGDVKRNG